MKSVIITGSSGFLGSNLVQEFRSRGFETLSKFNKDAVALFHTSACGLKPSIDLPIECSVLKNILQTVDLLEKVRRFNPEMVFVFSSTGSVYQNNSRFHNEDEPLLMDNPYTISKVACEKYIEYYQKEFGLKTVILRYFNLVGRYQVKGVVPTFIDRIKNNKKVTIYGDGKQIRCFTNVKDVVEANIKAFANEKAYNKTFNISSNRQITINELALLVGKLLNEKVEIEHKDELKHDIKKIMPDTFMAKKYLDFKTTHTLEEAIRDIILDGKK